MNESLFNQLYNDALIKAAIGVHIINTVGEQSNVSPEMQEQNIITLVTELAEGVNLDVEVVLMDVMTTRNNFPADFFEHPEVRILTQNLTAAMNPQYLIGNHNAILH